MHKKLLIEKHTKYRSGMGSLIYLLKYSRPVFLNIIKNYSNILVNQVNKIKQINKSAEMDY